MKNIFFIAGEPSGDLICSKILSHYILKPDNIGIHGLFGERTKSLGFKSIFDMSDISVMGFVEILPKIFKIIKRINQTVQEIEKILPNVVATIDSPGFSKAVVKKLRKRGVYSGKIIHIVAPSVWAYKEKRAKKMSELYHELLCFFDFEPKYFTKHGLTAKFIGNISIEDEIFDLKNNIIQAKKIDKIKTIAITLGSRENEINRHFNIIVDFIKGYKNDIKYIFPTISRFEKMITDGLSKNGLSDICRVIAGSSAMSEAVDLCDIGIAKSGTNTMQFLSKLKPVVVYYKINKMSYWIIKSMIKIKFINLVNIVSNRKVIPELVQDDFTPENISQSIEFILQKNPTDDIKNAILQMAPNGIDEKPSFVAWRRILELSVSE
jgi:lipid-A-disaccharide synthase